MIRIQNNAFKVIKLLTIIKWLNTNPHGPFKVGNDNILCCENKC